MYIGIINVLLACLCWGLIFVVPSIIEGFNPFEIALGRFFCYGFISFSWILLSKRHLLSKKYLPVWKKAAWFGLISTLICYIGMVFGIRYANPAVTALIFAMSPITIAFLGNYLRKEFEFSQFFLPSLFMLIGIVIANLPAFQSSTGSLGYYLLGLGSAFLGLTAWTWYTVNNSIFLSKQSQVSMSEWNLMMGGATFILVLITSCFLPWLSQDASKYLSFEPKMQTFFIASLILGVISTWFAFFFWNSGSKRLPISIAGQLMVFEVIFGLTFIYLLEKRVPIFIEILGIIFMLTGVLIGCRKLVKLKLEQTA